MPSESFITILLSFIFFLFRLFFMSGPSFAQGCVWNYCAQMVTVADGHCWLESFGHYFYFYQSHGYQIAKYPSISIYMYCSHAFRALVPCNNHRLCYLFSTTRTGPDNTGQVVWAIGKSVSFYFVFFFNTDYCFYSLLCKIEGSGDGNRPKRQLLSFGLFFISFF